MLTARGVVSQALPSWQPPGSRARPHRRLRGPRLAGQLGKVPQVASHADTHMHTHTLISELHRNPSIQLWAADGWRGWRGPQCPFWLNQARGSNTKPGLSHPGWTHTAARGPGPGVWGKAWRPLPPGADRHGRALPNPTVGAWEVLPPREPALSPSAGSSLTPKLPACLHLPLVLSPIRGRDRPSTASLVPALTR